MQVKAEGDQIMLDGHAFQVDRGARSGQAPVEGSSGSHVVIESTGLFTAREKAALHLSAGARKRS